MGARLAGHSPACCDLIPTANVHSMTCGDLARYNLDVGREMAAMGSMVRIWEENASSPGRLTSSSPAATALGPASARGKNSKLSHNRWPKENEGHMTGAC